MSPRRIVVYGVTGSGKTTLAARLARELDLSHIELDSLFHGPNWTPTPVDEFLAKVTAALAAAPRGWVVEGNYSAVRPRILPLADTAIWLDLPWVVSYRRMFRRTFRRMFRGEELWNGNKETPRNLLMSWDSLLWWGIHHHRRSRERIGSTLRDVEHNATVEVVRSGRELEELVSRLVAANASGFAVSGGEAGSKGRV
jgi:adenylate kinase family enzyme